MKRAAALLALSLGAPAHPHAVGETGSSLPGIFRGLEAGKTVEVPDGSYVTDSAIVLVGLRGTEGAPITLRAAHRGKAVIGGRAGFALKDCEHVVIEGFVFENDANQQAVLLEDCRHVRVTRCTFRPSEAEKARWGQYWAYVVGANSGHNRIDHNLFERQTNRGSMVFVRGDDATLAPSRHDQIDHNHFRDVVYANGANGHETLRTGGNDLGAAGKSTFTVIEHNLFERCSGEQEILSLKSSGNVVRKNTFIDCRGSICLRLGNRSEVCGNVMLNPGGVEGAGGVKIYGFGHRVYENYFQDLTGTDHEAPLALIPGIMDTETTDQIGKAYRDLTSAPATRAAITGNIWIDCAPLVFGRGKPDKDRTFVPDGCTFAQNVVARTRAAKSPLIQLGLVRDLRAADNIAHAPETPPNETWASWFRWEEPETENPKPLTRADVGPEAPGI